MAAKYERRTYYMCDMAAYDILNAAAGDAGNGLCGWVCSNKAEGSLFCITNYSCVDGWKVWKSTLPDCAREFVPNFLRAIGLPEDDASLDSMLAFLNVCSFTVMPSPDPFFSEIVFTTGNAAFFQAMNDYAKWRVVCQLVEYMFSCSSSPNNGPYRFWPIFRAKYGDSEPWEECCLPGYVRLPPGAVEKNTPPFRMVRPKKFIPSEPSFPSVEEARLFCEAGGLPFEVDDIGLYRYPPRLVLEKLGVKPGNMEGRFMEGTDPTLSFAKSKKKEADVAEVHNRITSE